MKTIKILAILAAVFALVLVSGTNNPAFAQVQDPDAGITTTLTTTLPITNTGAVSVTLPLTTTVPMTVTNPGGDPGSGDPEAGGGDFFGSVAESLKDLAKSVKSIARTLNDAMQMLVEVWPQLQELLAQATADDNAQAPADGTTVQPPPEEDDQTDNALTEWEQKLAEGDYGRPEGAPPVDGEQPEETNESPPETTEADADGCFPVFDIDGNELVRYRLCYEDGVLSQPDIPRDGREHPDLEGSFFLHEGLYLVQASEAAIYPHGAFTPEIARRENGGEIRVSDPDGAWFDFVGYESQAGGISIVSQDLFNPGIEWEATYVADGAPAPSYNYVIADDGWHYQAYLKNCDEVRCDAYTVSGAIQPGTYETMMIEATIVDEAGNILASEDNHLRFTVDVVTIVTITGNGGDSQGSSFWPVK